MKQVILVILLIPTMTFAQKTVDSTMIKKYCQLINEVRQNNEVINAMLFKAVLKEYPHTTYVEFQKKAENLYSEKKVLKNMWDTYKSFGSKILIESHFKKLGFTQGEAEIFGAYIQSSEYEK